MHEDPLEAVQTPALWRKGVHLPCLPLVVEDLGSQWRDLKVCLRVSSGLPPEDLGDDFQGWLWVDRPISTLPDWAQARWRSSLLSLPASRFILRHEDIPWALSALESKRESLAWAIDLELGESIWEHYHKIKSPLAGFHLHRRTLEREGAELFDRMGFRVLTESLREDIPVPLSLSGGFWTGASLDWILKDAPAALVSILFNPCSRQLWDERRPDLYLDSLARTQNLRYTS